MGKKKDWAPEGFDLDSLWGSDPPNDEGPNINVLGIYRTRNPTQMAYPYKLLKKRPKEGDRIKVRVRNGRTNNELTFTTKVSVLRSNIDYGYLNFKRNDEIHKGDVLYILDIRLMSGMKIDIPVRPNRIFDLDNNPIGSSQHPTSKIG